MKLDIKKLASTRSDRVKGVDFHPTEPWVLTTLYSGKAEIWTYDTNTLVRTFDVTNVPVRAGKFIARKNWIVVGADDFQVRVFNYNTGEKVTQFEAHPDYIRSIAVHPSRPYVLTSSDDYTIKLWNWEHNWKLEQTFEGHQHYVMSIAFNPKDSNTFASACLDKTVKIWSLGSKTPNFTLVAPDSKGFNYVDYYPHGDKPYIITSSDDRTIKVWDYQTKSCVAVLEDHLSNVSFAIFHPELPLIISGSEDATIKIWNSNTYKLERTLNYRMERAWCVATKKNSSLLAVGFDTGHIVIQLGDDKPLLSMDPMGKIVSCKHTDVYHSVIKVSDTKEINDGEILSLTQKELGSVEFYPSSLVHSPNGRFVAVTGDDEYIIYTALAWRNKTYGQGFDFVWAQDSNYYAIRESKSSVKLFKNFKEKTTGTVELVYAADKIFGGALLTVKSEGFISFYDWESGQLVRRVDVEAENVVWSENGELVLIISSGTAFALSFNRALFQEKLTEGTIDPEEGVEESFKVLYDVEDQIVTGRWVGDVFIYTSSSNRLNYLVGGSINNLAHFDKPMFMLGYMPRDNRVYVADKDLNVVSYYLSLAVLEYQTVVLRGEMEEADELLPSIDEKDLNKVARFLEQRGFKEKALKVSRDPEERFELALSTLNLELAAEIAGEHPTAHKWKKLGDTALAHWDISLATKAFAESKDLQSLLLIYTSINDELGLKQLSQKAVDAGKYNIAFSASWAAKDVESCIEILQKSERLPEATFLSLIYTGEKTKSESAVKLWKIWLEKNGKSKLAERLCLPSENSSKFPELNGDAEQVKEEEPKEEEPKEKESKEEESKEEPVELVESADPAESAEQPKKQKKSKKKAKKAKKAKDLSTVDAEAK
ncbi:hypothetical protein FOA43_001587 [Brettanomyces nanus]|uniref:Coatomer subunit beta' n=1 Tax=Eeniella nana TaxID=13502 RepID=A0A875S2F3_EENNA|nr:uncharacterized protein FOA43_001587 [Brettanomyces nanus]QPG74262.1 hypothetical protein FOA43_001587 [Brettanomyces nanus]